MSSIPQRSDHWGYASARMSTRPYIPGPCGIWRRDFYLRMMEHHPFLPFGEDIFGSYHGLLLGWRFEQELRCTVKTFAPPVLIEPPSWLGKTFVDRVQGYGAATIWKQRAHRWTVSGCRVLPLSFYLFWFYQGSRDLSAALWFRLFRLREWKVRRHARRGGGLAAQGTNGTTTGQPRRAAINWHSAELRGVMDERCQGV